MEHLFAIIVFLASISAILLVSGLIILKTNFPLNSRSTESDQKITLWFQGNELRHNTDAAHNMLRDLKLADGLADLLTFFNIIFLVQHRLQMAKTASTNSVRLGSTIRQFCGLQKNIKIYK